MHKPRLYPALLIICLLVAGVAGIGYLPARHYIASVQEKVIESLGSALQKNVDLRIEGARLGLRHGFGFRLYNLTLREKGAPGHEIFTAKYLFVALDIMALVRGDLRIDRIYVLRPRICLVRYASGEFNVGGLLSVADRKKEAPDPVRGESLRRIVEPLLCKDQIILKSGEILVKDMKRDDPVVARIRQLDVMVVNRLESDRLEISLSGQVAKPALSGAFSVEGSIAGWNQALTARELKSDFVFSFKDIDSHGLMACISGWQKGDDIQGLVDGTFSYQGSLLLPGTGRFEIALKNPLVSVARAHPRPFSPEAVSVQSAYNAGTAGLVFSDGRIDLDRMPIRWEGRLDFVQGEVSYLDFSIRAPGLPLLEAGSYMPLGLLNEEVWRFLAALPRAGHVDAEARLKGAPEDFTRMEFPQGEDAIYLKLVFRDCTTQLPVEESYLPFRSLNGTLELTRGTLFFRRFGFRYGSTLFSDVNGSIENIHRSASFLRILGKARLDVPEMFRELDHGIFPEAVREIARNMKDASGDGTLQVGLDFRFGRGQDNKIRIRGEAVLEDVGATYESLGVDLSGLTGRIVFTESALSDLKIVMIVGRSRVVVKGGVRFPDVKSGPDGEILFESPCLYIGDLLRASGSPKWIDGTLSLAGSVSWPDGSLCWKADVSGGRISFPAGRYYLAAEDLKAVIEGRGDSLQLRSLSADLQGSGILCEGRWESLNPLVGQFEVRSRHVDVNRLLGTKREDAASEEMIGRAFRDFFRSRAEVVDHGTNIRLKLDLGGVEFRTVSLTDVVAEASLQGGKLRINLGRANIGDGTAFIAADADLGVDNCPYSLFYSLNGVPAEEFYRAFSMKEGALEGTMALEGNLKGNLQPSGSRLTDLSGAFSVFSDHCTIRRYDALSKVLALINFTQWTRMRISDFNEKGIPCRQIKGKFHIEKGSLTTDDLTIDSSVALMALQGAYDIEAKRLDAGLSLRPLEPIDQVLDLLPVVGWVIHGPDGTIVEFHYRIKGPLEDLQVRLVPFRGLNDRLGSPLRKLDRWLRSLNDDGSEKKEQ